MPQQKTNFEIRTTTADIVHEGKHMIVAVQWNYTILGTPALSSVYDGRRDITGEMNTQSYNKCVTAMQEASSNEQVRGGMG